MATYSQVCSNVGSFTYGNRFTLYVVLTNRDGDPATNKSWVDYNVYFENTSGGGTFTSNTRLYFALNGGVIKDSTSSITGPRNGQVSIASGSTQIEHNADGTKSISYHALVKSTSFGISGEISGTFALTTIPRASTITCSTANIESNATITITSASTNFTHSVYAYFGSQYVVIATNQKGGSFTWKIPTSFYAQIPDNVRGQGTIYCETYSGGTLIGTKTAVFHVTTDVDKCRPTVTGTVVDINETTKALTGNANKLILGKSTAKITVTPVAKNSATIKTVTIDGTADTDYTTNKTNVTKASFPIVVTDSRGYQNTSYSATASGGTVNYVPLTFNATIFRPQPTGTEIQMTYSGNYFNSSFGATNNTLSITWKYRVQGASSWTNGGTITPTLSGNTISSKTISLGTNYDYQTAYDFQITAVDKLTTITQTIAVSVGMPIFYWGKDFLRVTGKFNINNTIQGGNVPLGETVDGGSFNDVEKDKKLNKSGLYTINDNTAWYNLINVRHRNGNSDGVGHGMQIKSPLTTVYPSLQIRQQTSSSWGGWFDVPIYTVLFNDSNGRADTITISNSSANFLYLEFYFMLSVGEATYYFCERVCHPNGKTLGYSFNRPTNSSASGDLIMQYFGGRISISGTTITRGLESFISINGSAQQISAASYASRNVKITKILGYR